MLGEAYLEGPYTKEYIESLLRRLSREIGPKKVVITGVYFDDVHLGAAVYNADTDQVDYAFSHRIDGYYHGTGDVFASAVLAAVLSGSGLKEAIEIAVNFTVGSIKRTKEAQTDIRFGVNFEAGLKDLANILNK
ncbi:hypothetical protein SDC9_178172 [bioreactor metagenome]|uniref:Pyridoxamine kinase/Phosphomethylpyrimidine kinase domain-containing protein n=1 Tax=bioreactor metagenome TaxID=1076179 RepID=A0A645GV20_9ZZZZ